MNAMWDIGQLNPRDLFKQLSDNISSLNSTSSLDEVVTRTDEESLTELLTLLAEAVETLTLCLFKTARSLWVVLSIGMRVLTHFFFFVWTLSEPVAARFLQLETRTRWGWIVFIIIIIIPISMYRRRTLTVVTESLTTAIGTIPLISIFIFFDIIPRLYLPHHLYKILHFTLIFLVPTAFSLLAVIRYHYEPYFGTGDRNTLSSKANKYSNSTSSPCKSKQANEVDANNVPPSLSDDYNEGLCALDRGSDGSTSHSEREARTVTDAAEDFGGSPGDILANAKLSDMELMASEKCALALAKNKRFCNLYNNEATDKSSTSVHYNQLPVWLEYWVVVTLLKFFFSIVTSVVLRLVPCTSLSTSLLDSPAILRPLDYDYCPLVIQKLLAGYQIAEVLSQLLNVLLVVAVRQEHSEIVHSLKRALWHMIESLIEVFTGVQVKTIPYARGGGQARSMIVLFLSWWKFIVVKNTPTRLRWVYMIVLKLPHIVLLLLPAFMLRPLVSVVGVAVPAISSLRELESMKQHDRANVDVLSTFVIYFTLLSIYDVLASLAKFFIVFNSLLPTTHIYYLGLLGLQLLASATPMAVETASAGFLSSGFLGGSAPPQPKPSRHSMPAEVNNSFMSVNLPASDSDCINTYPMPSRRRRDSTI